MKVQILVSKWCPVCPQAEAVWKQAAEKVPMELQVLDVAETYFHTVFWCYPFLGSIFLYRNALQGLGYGLVPMVGGIFELVARTGIIMLVAGHTSFAGVCLADPAAWISALIPLIPYYIYTMRKWEKQRTVKMTAN